MEYYYAIKKAFDEVILEYLKTDTIKGHVVSGYNTGAINWKPFPEYLTIWNPDNQVALHFIVEQDKWGHLLFGLHDASSEGEVITHPTPESILVIAQYTEGTEIHSILLEIFEEQFRKIKEKGNTEMKTYEMDKIIKTMKMIKSDKFVNDTVDNFLKKD